MPTDWQIALDMGVEAFLRRIDQIVRQKQDAVGAGLFDGARKFDADLGADSRNPETIAVLPAASFAALTTMSGTSSGDSEKNSPVPPAAKSTGASKLDSHSTWRW